MMKNDDLIPDAYKYSWSKESEMPLQEFLTKFKPSMVQNDGTKPWIWVSGTRTARDQTEPGVTEAVEEASAFLNTVTERVESIKNDESIPVRSNKKTGAKSKKEVREQVQAEATIKLKEISVKHKYVNGKWLIFTPAERVDSIWTGIATSLIEGPLTSTSAYTAKVSTSPAESTPNYQHIICVYMPDVYDKDKVTEVMKILLRNHGVNLSGVKSDLYTNIGLDSKHASGVPSTVWKNTTILSDKESRELKDVFFAQSQKASESKAAGGEKIPGTTSDEKAGEEGKASKSKPKLKKKVTDDPFGSESESDAKKPPLKSKSAASKPAKRTKQDSYSDENEDDQPKRKKATRS
ncbi:translation initiation factor eIF 4e-like domain-containing protein [Panaeolus papilionaceus]|nr:translation initiation factor eIF 4e-like domain-containing protein [Panaeolus papilionaceus]